MTSSTFTPPTLEEISKLLPAFEFTELFSTHAKGAVYFANQRSLDRMVAIKVQAMDEDTARQDAMDVFMKALAGLKHPNLVSIFDSGRINGMPYYVLEFVPGKSLGRSTKGVSVEFGQTLAILKDICDGLSHAQEQGIFHGNLNPSNILLNQRVEPKITNFGTKPRVGDIESMRFVAPEVTTRGAADFRSDVYSLAVIFYELITGAEYSGLAAPASSISGCKKAVDEVLSKALAHDPDGRFGSASEFYGALERAMNGVGAVAGGTNPVGNAVKPVAPLPSSYGKVSSKQNQTTGNLVLKVVVILILLVAVQQTWKYVGDAKRERALENKRILAKQEEERAQQKALAEAKKIEEERIRQLRLNTSSQGNVVREETTSESLERLRSALVSGNRGQMPVGTKQIGSSHYLYIADRKKWNDASRFAEEHGGHLVTDATTFDQLGKELTGGREYWIGAGWSGTSWIFVDGESVTATPKGEGMYVLADSTGQLVATDSRKDAGFVIQWRSDGKNPGSLKAQLERTKASLGSTSGFYPVGTVLAGERRLLCLPGEMNWKQANELAKSAGGELMVVSDDAEAEALEKLVSKLGSDKTFWLGGYLEGLHWKWVTGEPWREVKWAKGSNLEDDEVAMAIKGGSGWLAFDRDDSESGLVIEWSKDRDNNKAPVGESGDPVKATEELIAKAKELVVAATGRRALAQKKNDDNFGWNLSGFLKNLTKSGVEEWTPVVDELKECVGDEKVLVDEINARGITVARELVKHVEYHGTKQTEINEAYEAELEKIREGFLARVTIYRDEQKAKGQVKLVEYFEGLLEEASTLEKWVESMDLTLPKPAVPTVVRKKNKYKDDDDRDRDRDKDEDDEEDDYDE